MPEILRDPFEHLAAWVNLTGITIAAGRNGNGASMTPAAATDYRIPSAAESDAVTLGFAFRRTVLGNNTGVVVLGSDAGATAHLSLTTHADGSLDIRRGGTVGAVLGTAAAAGTLVINTWHYIEVQASLSDTVGTVEVRVNGVTKIGPLSTQDTKNFGTKTVFDTVRIMGATGSTTQYDDLYVRTGSEPFLGDITVAAGRQVLLEPFTDLSAFNFTSGSPPLVAGRNGTALQSTGTQLADFYIIDPAQRSDVWTVGFAFRRTDALASGSRDIIQTYSDVGGANTNHNRMMWTPSTGTLDWRRGSTVIASTTGVTFTQNTWYYLEAQFKLSDTAGFVIIRINGAAVLTSATNLDSKNGGTATVVEELRLICNQASAFNQYDDLYVKTGPNETFSGDIGAVADRGGPKLSRHAQRVALVEPIPVDHQRLTRHSLRVAFQGAATTARVGGIQARVLRKGGGGNARVGGMQVRVLRRYAYLAPSQAKVWTGEFFADAPVKTWTGSGFAAMTALRTWSGTKFEPELPAGVLGWWEADDAAAFTYSSGNVVSQWNDRSGGNRHMIQATVANQPTRSGTQNGRPTVVFDGINDFMGTATPVTTATDNITMVVACKRTGPAAGIGSTQSVVFQNGKATDGYGIALRATNANIGLLRGNILMEPTVTPDPAAPGVLTLTKGAPGVAWSLWLNGVQTNMASVGGVNAPATRTTLASDTHLWGGEIYAALLWGRVLSAAERIVVESYLKSKWGTP